MSVSHSLQNANKYWINMNKKVGGVKKTLSNVINKCEQKEIN
jgi:hypothetical protein